MAERKSVTAFLILPLLLGAFVSSPGLAGEPPLTGKDVTLRA